MTPNVGGIDFGFHNPFCALWGTLDHDDILWIYGCRYKSGVTLPVHAEALPKDVEWHADPAGAESIASLRQAGHDVRPCVHRPTTGASGEKKSPKLSGIDQVYRRMQTGRLKIIRNEQTMPLIRELGNYHYDEEKKVEEPVDEDNHAVDALRYAVVGIDRGRHVADLVETDEEKTVREEIERQKAAKELADKKADLLKRKAEDESRERSIFQDERWGNT